MRSNCLFQKTSLIQRVKKITITCVILILPFLMLSQAPELLNYQGVARESNGNVISDQNIRIEISILKIDPQGPVEFSEEHSTKTNDFGLFNIRIGEGNNQNGTIADVDWGDYRHYVKVQLDLMDGNGFVNLGTTQLYSVPYALFANESGSTSLENVGVENDIFSYTGDRIALLDGNGNSLVDLNKLSNGGGALRTLGPNGNTNILLSSLTTNENSGFLSVVDENNETKISTYVNQSSSGLVLTRGANSNLNAGLSHPPNFPNHGRIYVTNQDGNIRAELLVESTGYGRILTRGPNGNMNANISHLSDFPNHGMINVRDSNGDTQAGIYVDANGNGRVFADAVDALIDHPTKSNLQLRYTHLQGPEAGTYLRGTAYMENGTAIVDLPDHFSRLIDATSMTVMITPLSADSKGIAVVKKSGTGFRVKELLEGKGNYEFDWEIKAVRKGYENYPLFQKKLESKLVDSSINTNPIESSSQINK